MRDSTAGKNIIDYIRSLSDSDDFKESLSTLLAELCSISTVPDKNQKDIAAQELSAFNELLRYLNRYIPSGQETFKPMNQTILDHPYFTPPYYSDSPGVYENRFNLLYSFRGKSGKGEKGLAFNAHIDTVGPFFETLTGDGYVEGRGAADDKGGCTAIAGAFQLLAKTVERFGIELPFPLIGMFVIDEETGGNGSLSLAVDTELFSNIGSMVVVESFDHQIYPANRGALWYKIDMQADASDDRLLFFARLIKEIEKTGRQLREESNHPLFPDRPAHTCQGILGRYGEHPSRICPGMSFDVQTKSPKKEVIRHLEKGLEKYLTDYRYITEGPAQGDYYTVEDAGSYYTVRTRGRSGHMGSSLKYHNAITIAAYLIDALSIGIKDSKLYLSGEYESSVLSLEGGQGFLPPHTVQDIRRLLDAALKRTWEAFAKEFGIPSKEMPLLTTDKLHNEAFERRIDSETIRNAVRAAELLNLPAGDPLVGAPVSCDARIFAREYPELEIFTTGPGSLSEAHSDRERISVSDLCSGAAFLALFALFQGGILKLEDLKNATNCDGSSKY